MILYESMILGFGGGVLGWLMGHGLSALAGPVIEAKTGVSIGFFDFAPRIDLVSLVRPGGRGLDDSAELVLIPALLLLPAGVGPLPARTAYRTDVAESLGK
jgi:putative ABC transport system permease protein